MWQDDELDAQLKENYMVATAPRVLAEFNINATATQLAMGSYKKPYGVEPFGAWLEDSQFYIKYNEPLDTAKLTFLNSQTDLMNEYYSLADCFKFRRPRAGIIYTQFPGERTKTYIENYSTSRRPRHYIVGKNMEFRYWNSSLLKTIDTDTAGVSNTVFSDTDRGYQIQDTVPFIVYNDVQYANKIVVKMQTYNGERIATIDPIADTWRIPVKWSIQYLDEQLRWQTVKNFTVDDIIPTDGHIELMYGVSAPIGYTDTFRLYGSIEFLHELDQIPTYYRHIGMAYQYQDITLKVWDGATWVDQPLEYGWIPAGPDVFEYAVTDIVSPNTNEFVKLRGVRLVIHSMSAPEIPFELIELSPRLQINITRYTGSFEMTKSLGLSDQLPFGSLSNDLGFIELFNYDGAFSSENKYDGTTGSIISQYMHENTKLIFYNEIKDAVAHNSKFVQLKTLYVEQWPLNDPGTGEMRINLRDYYLFFEKLSAPDLFFQNISLTYVVSILLDNIGFTNYSFIGFNATNDIIIPYFFCNKTSNILDVLNDLVKAARCVVYFDEYNNFIMSSKEHLSGVDRVTDNVLQGTGNDEILSNIETLVVDRRQLYNDGAIQFSPKYIKKGEKSTTSSYFVGRNNRRGYQPTTLWELANDTSTEYTSPSQNSSEFVLSAVVLNEPLTNVLPSYNTGTLEITNNIIDLGSSVYFLNRLSGYLYANSEIIRYDAIEFNIGALGKVWVSYNDEFVYYQNTVGFNQFIEKTGRVRIWTEIVGNVLTHHGRGYFNTPVVNHSVTAGPFWISGGGWDAMEMEHKPLFSPCLVISFIDYDIHPDPAIRWSVNNAGTPGTRAPAPTFVTKTSLDAGSEKMTMKLSAMNWKGPQQVSAKNARTVNYFRKPFPANVNYTRFGTRLRIVGEPVNSDADQVQRPDSSMKLFESADSTQYIGADCSSGGLSLFTDSRHQGYFLEVLAFGNNLSNANSQCEGAGTAFHQIIFYKVMSVTAADGRQLSMPFKLWGGELAVTLDSGVFVSEDAANNDTPNVIDLEVEVYNDTFDIYVNGIKMGTAVDDVNQMVLLHQSYFTPEQAAAFDGDANRNVIRSIPVLGTGSKEYGVFIRGDSRVLFENVWAMQKSPDAVSAENYIPAVFGKVEVDNAYGRGKIEKIFRRHKLSGFIQQEYLQNIVNNGYRYAFDYEEFGTILRECYIVNARYTDAFPAFYARILPTLDSANPLAISNELVGQYDTEFMLFNVADKGIIVQNETGIKINGIVLTDESNMQITVDQYIQRRRSDTNQLRDLEQILKESRRKYGTSLFTLESTPYLQSITQVESILNWATRYLLEEKLWASATIFSNPMLQLGDVLSIDNIRGDTMPDGIRMVIDEINYKYDQQGPAMTLQLREVP